MTRPAVPTIALAATLLAGCGGGERATVQPAISASDVAAATATADARAPARTTAATRPRAPAARGRKIETVDSQFGRILADGRGQAVYVFDRETTSRPRCDGKCARAWPPVLTNGRPVAGSGVRARRLGTTRRRDGRRQVTLNGRPLYSYVADAPGRVLCHDVDEFGGLWLVVRADGTPVP